jgi:hypothetical protein
LETRQSRYRLVTNHVLAIRTTPDVVTSIATLKLT